MDPVTHTLTGALIGQAGLKRKTGLAMPALLVGANLPDIDVACFLWLDGVEHLAFRRGITHGPIAWVLLPLLLAGALWWFDRWQARRGTRPEGRLPVRFGWLYGLSFLACLTHPALDWLNVYGIRLFEPFSSRWFYGDVLFIIDVWLWAIMGVGLWLSVRREQVGGKWRRPASISVIIGALYVGINIVISAAAYASVPRNVWAEHGELIVVSPPPFLFWERETVKDSGISISENGSLVSYYDIGRWRPIVGYSRDVRVPNATCAWDDVLPAIYSSKEGEAFAFWTRLPFVEPASDGSVLLRDARYYDPRARNRFTVALRHVRCEPVR